uniref:Uncharacterized protein n=1 Tax=Arundo donax TaxID=35708 RepID=A0A0A8YIW0_ARUDO
MLMSYEEYNMAVDQWNTYPWS